MSSAELLDRARRVIRADADAVLATLAAVDDAFLEVAGLLSTCAGKILVTGSGTSGAVASRAAHLLSVGGTPAFYLPPADGLHGGLGVLQPGDIVLALSKGGSSAELNSFCARARTLCGCLVSITAVPESELGRMSDHVIRLALPDDADLGSVVATGSSLASAAVTDALVEVTRVARGYGWDKILFTHPSGAVGRDAEASLKRLAGAGAGS
ncbi:SIS domain-containing protein [Aestuariivirga sp. YIM B02566]|uniref:SIS domain-containing protein n=1 Tax=Taklimakanibacter albus TaxID=2800327 RepID=A0ACC5RD20_9HYPH|nr:SIS domain-containing protein [Aestuariivirga sp. YIM B02566]MBK1870370.1 SIS domain-containing protein [Aestuariivirga sp. YIM B02566]